MYKQYKLEVASNTSVSSEKAREEPEPPAKPKRQKSNLSSKKSEGKNWKPLQRHKSSWNKDVMISYSHQNKQFMRQLKEALEKRDITVWVDEIGLKAGVDFLSKIGEAIIDAKFFISLLSDASIKSKYCQDELALAYVSSKPIFPVGLDTPEVLFPLMDTGMKLQLARFRWHIFKDPDRFEETMDELVATMKAKKEGKEGAGDMMGDTTETERKTTDKRGHRKVFNRQSMKKSLIFDKVETGNDKLSEEEMKHFWSRHFEGSNSVPWKDFEAAFNQDYGEVLNMIYGEQEKEWLMSIVMRELEVTDKQNGSVMLDLYLDFCTIDDEIQPFFLRVQDQAVESYTMKEVFSMDSSVRIEAIENLGKFRSAAVIEALLDLLKDPDNNVRAVAAISLARTGDDSGDIISALLHTLKDKDRLVRESGCLALGHLKATSAVKQILHLWRNDFISHVREAAQVALEQIGGEEAEKAIHMTKVLSDEIRFLTNE